MCQDAVFHPTTTNSPHVGNVNCKTMSVLFVDPHTPEHHYYDRQLQSECAPLYQDSCQHRRARRRIRAIKQVTQQAPFQSCVSVPLSCCWCLTALTCVEEELKCSGGRSLLGEWNGGSWVTVTQIHRRKTYRIYESFFFHHSIRSRFHFNPNSTFSTCIAGKNMKKSNKIKK